MNFIEGFRRLGIGLAWLLAIAFGGIFLIDSPPTQESRDFSTMQTIRELIWNDQSVEFRSSSSQYSLQQNLWGDKTATQIVADMCQSPKDNRLKLICEEAKTSMAEKAWLWAMHIGQAVGIGMLVGGIWSLLWSGFMWVVRGFVRAPR